MRWLSLLIPVMLGLLSCRPSDGFQCMNDAACSNDGIAGECQPTGYCSFPDPECASGQRYGELAELFAQQCVPSDEDTETGTGTEGACTDGGGGACDGSSDTGETTCGNGSLDPGEACDGDLQMTCSEAGLGGDGVVECRPDCTLDAAACGGCGNGIAEDGEACDGLDLNGAACSDIDGFSGGTLGCADNCTFDPQECSFCGDGKLQRGEDCDGRDLGDATCQSQGFDGGLLACSQRCELDVSECAGNGCGDGLVGPSEACDGDIVDENCDSVGAGIGPLSCDINCEYDVSQCSDPATVSTQATGEPTDQATITLTCEDGNGSCIVDRNWQDLSEGCEVVCGESSGVTVSASYPMGGLTVPQSIQVGPMSIACNGSNPCEATVTAEDGLVLTVEFVAIG